MTAPQDRRGFLRALVSLSLIGGGVTLIGNPSAAAVPMTPDLLDSYSAWLEVERRALLAEIYGAAESVRHYGRVPWNNAGERFFRDPFAAPSTRAAVVLSAVGCDWRGPRGGRS
jgi:hypothetical protein